MTLQEAIEKIAEHSLILIPVQVFAQADYDQWNQDEEPLPPFKTYWAAEETGYHKAVCFDYGTELRNYAGSNDPVAFVGAVDATVLLGRVRPTVEEAVAFIVSILELETK